MKFTQQDIEDRTGLKRCYLSRVENGNTVPSIHTVEKLAFALEVPMYRLFFDGEGPPPDPPIFSRSGKSAAADAESYAETAHLLAKMSRIWAKLDASSRERLFSIAKLMAGRRRSRPTYRKKSGPPRRIAPENTGVIKV
jgi:transcriptional regulator with XRE-family HTH domain